LVRKGVLRSEASRGFTAPASFAPPPEAITASVRRMEIEVPEETTDERRIVLPPPAASAAPVPAVSETFSRALVDFREGRLEAARAGLGEVLALEPLNALARERLAEVERALTDRARAAGLTDRRRVRLSIPVQKLVGIALS